MQKTGKIKQEYFNALQCLLPCRCGTNPVLWRSFTYWRVTCPKCKKRQFGDGPVDAAIKWNWKQATPAYNRLFQEVAGFEMHL